MTLSIDTYADILHATDLIALRDEITERIADGAPEDTDAADLAFLTEFEDLENLAYEHEILIRWSHFTDYAQELADDIGALPTGLQWPLTCIDWEQAARELRYDYAPVEIGGVEYWYRYP